MTRPSDWSERELKARLAGPGVMLKTGPFVSRVRSRIPAVVEGIGQLYADYPVAAAGEFADYDIALVRPYGPRRWVRPQVNFLFDGQSVFKPLPLAQALPLLEWGLNWCIGNHAHQFLIVHAAVVERHGRAAILPGPPGSGKSTLTAYLVHKGWRLLSDELTLLSLDGGRVCPLARPISLKNESIEVIGRLVPGATFSRKAEHTGKGTVALLKAPAESVARADESARPAWIVFPRFEATADADPRPRSKADTLIEVGRNAFNYSIHGRTGFDALCRLMNACDCYDLTYGDLPAALEVFASLSTPPVARERLA